MNPSPSNPIFYSSLKHKGLCYYNCFKIKNYDGSYLHPEILERIVNSFGLSNEEILQKIDAIKQQDLVVLLLEFEREIGFGKNGSINGIKSLGEAFLAKDQVDNGKMFD